MGLGEKWKLFGKHYRAYSSETYKDTMQAVDRVASTSLLLLQSKSEEERRQILDRAANLVGKLTEAIAEEIPLVVVTALLLTLRVQEQMLGEQAKLRGR
jgi:hypothetical protein